MIIKKNEANNQASIQIEDLKRLRNLIVNHRMFDSDLYNLKEVPITETLRLLLHVYLESDWPTTVGSEERIVINDHFWMAYETASYIERLDDPSGEKDAMLIALDQVIDVAYQLQEVAS